MCMEAESRGVMRWTLGSAAIWFSAFAGISVAQAWASGVSPLEAWAPIGSISVIGGPVGGLIGPMTRGLFLRIRHR